MLDSIVSFGFVTLFGEGFGKPDPGLVLSCIQGERFLKAFNGFRYVAPEHFGRHQILTSKAGPNQWILVIKSHGPGVLLFDLGAKLWPCKHRRSQPNLSTVKI